MPRRHPTHASPTVTRVAVMLRGDALSMARRRPVSTSLHRAVTRESGRLFVAHRDDDAAALSSGDRQR
jgi:hypothetical protein